MTSRMLAVFAVVALLGLGLGVSAWIGRQRAPTAPPQVDDGLRAAPTAPRFFRFALTDHGGRPLTDGDLRGRWLLVYAGFTTCPDICPTELGYTRRLLADLGPSAERFTPVLLSVDPERDTPVVLAEYVALFHPRLIGLTGSLEAVHAAVDALGGTFAKAPAPGETNGFYLVDHTMSTYVIDPQGRLRGSYDATRTRARVAADLSTLLAETP